MRHLQGPDRTGGRYRRRAEDVFPGHCRGPVGWREGFLGGSHLGSLTSWLGTKDIERKMFRASGPLHWSLLAWTPGVWVWNPGRSVYYDHRPKDLVTDAAQAVSFSVDTDPETILAAVEAWRCSRARTRLQMLAS